VLAWRTASNLKHPLVYGAHALHEYIKLRYFLAISLTHSLFLSLGFHTE
jgi:hypothetical protein